MSIFGQAVDRLRPTTRTTRAGDEVEDWANPTRTPIDRLSVQPNYQNEATDGDRDMRASGYRVLTEPGHVPDIEGTDRIEYRGKVHVVTGEVALWPDPHGLDHVEFTMTEFKGA